MIQHWISQKYTDHQYFGIGGFGEIETFVSDPLGEVAPTFTGELHNLFLTRGASSKVIDYSGYFSNTPTSYSISPAVPSDWSFNTSTGVLTIDPTTEGAYGFFTITASNGAGSANSNAFQVTVNVSVGGSYRRGRTSTLKPLSYYEEKVKDLIAKEKEKLEKELKSEEAKLEEAVIEEKEAKLADNREQFIEDEIRILLIQVEIQALIDKIAEIELNNAKIRELAAILQDDDEVLELLAMKGFL